MSDTISTPATKYRVAIRDIAVANGWTFNQLSTSIDQFTKGDDVVAVQHGPSNLISTAERRIGDKGHDVVSRAGKMFQVQAWLTGQPDPDHTRYIRLTPEQVRRYESGQGIAKISRIDLPEDKTVTVAAPSTAPAKKPVTKVRKLTDAEIEAAKKAAAGPAKAALKPKPRAPRRAPVVASK